MNSKKRFSIAAVILVLCVLFSCCSSDLSKTTEESDNDGEKRTFFTSFESADEFSNYYIVSQNYKNTTHDLSTEIVYDGTYSHKAWIIDSYIESTSLENNNHRAYPTIQLYKDSQGAFVSPCLITFYVWVDMILTEHSPENQWLSFATITGDSSDNWYPVVCVNLSCDGFVHLMHIPTQGEKDYIFQTTDVRFPMREWVELKIYYDNREDGYVKVWQNGELVSYGSLDNGNGLLSQAHFGLYAAPSIGSGIVYNDCLTIKEVSGEE
ncbi:MAG: polysaccharide lyase [Clostridia bacterium]|nr:polysaccharide lyase [Clostridia bacterium]